MSRLWLGVLHMVVSCLVPLKHTCCGFTYKLLGQGLTRGRKGACLVFLCRGGPTAGPGVMGNSDRWEALRRLRGNYIKHFDLCLWARVPQALW